MANGGNIAPTSSPRVQWVIARPGRTLTLAGVIAVLTDSVFVGHCRVHPGRGRGWTPLTNASDLAVVARQVNVVCLTVSRGEAARVLLTSTSALGFTKADDLHGAVTAARFRVLDAAGVSFDPDGP